jgi:hypothetical protein
MWKFRPEPEQWTIHEIVIHIVDSEANSYIRCRRLIAEPGKDLMAYDENRWAQELEYHEQDTDEALSLFRWLRKRSYELIKQLPEHVWTHQSFHPELGVTTMEDWLETYERHIPEHVDQMDAVFRRWQQQL